MFKVVAPEGWTARKNGYTTDVASFKVNKPIEQNINGSKGVYELVYFMKDSKALDRFQR